MFVGYSTKNAGDCYHMYDPNTKRILVNRDVCWLNRLYYDKGDEKQDDNGDNKKVRFQDMDVDDDAMVDIPNTSNNTNNETKLMMMATMMTTRRLALSPSTSLFAYPHLSVVVSVSYDVGGRWE